MMLLDPTTWLIPKKKGNFSFYLCFSLPACFLSTPQSAQQQHTEAPKSNPLLAASASSDPVSTPSLKQITPWPTSSFHTTLACSCASQNYASVFALRFRRISSVHLVTEKYCWQSKIPHINNKRTENWGFICLLYVTSVCLIMLKQSFKVCVASWPSINSIFAITIILIFCFFVVRHWISAWFVIKVRHQRLNSFLINVCDNACTADNKNMSVRLSEAATGRQINFAAYLSRETNGNF